MGGNLPPGCTDADIDRAAQGHDEPPHQPTSEEEEAAAWEYWYEHAISLKSENNRLRRIIKDAVDAYQDGYLQMNSPEIGEPENDIPMHQWHEEWLHLARAALKVD